MARNWRFLVPTLIAFSTGCSGNGSDNVSAMGANSGMGGAGTGSGGTGSGVGGGSVAPTGNGTVNLGTAGSATSEESVACAAESSEAQLQPVYLAFAFDVSGSMGKLDYPYHDPTLKWEPVVAATKAFFADPDAAGLSASLAFFPAEEDRCESVNYETPEVPMTPLPSAAFAAAIDAVTPQSADDWRGGTPTLAVVEGTLAYLAPFVAENPAAKFALVLVTDGYPQSCDDNSIESVANAVAAATPTISTFVIGVNNPPDLGGPETLDDLNAIALAGGTNQAFIIATGDPDQTSADLKAVVDGIRNVSVSCNIEIPPPPANQVFDKDKVNVTYSSAGAANALGYDPTCALTNSWRYDDAANPTLIELCASTCATVQADVSAALTVEFGCATRPAQVF